MAALFQERNNLHYHSLHRVCFCIGNLYSAYILTINVSIPFKTLSAEKKLAPPETRVLKVNISQKIRPLCGIHIKCINITKSTPLVDAFQETMSSQGRVPRCS